MEIIRRGVQWPGVTNISWPGVYNANLPVALYPSYLVCTLALQVFTYHFLKYLQSRFSPIRYAWFSSSTNFSPPWMVVIVNSIIMCKPIKFSLKWKRHLTKKLYPRYQIYKKYCLIKTPQISGGKISGHNQQHQISHLQLLMQLVACHMVKINRSDDLHVAPRCAPAFLWLKCGPVRDPNRHLHTPLPPHRFIPQ